MAVSELHHPTQTIQVTLSRKMMETLQALAAEAAHYTDEPTTVEEIASILISWHVKPFRTDYLRHRLKGRTLAAKGGA